MRETVRSLRIYLVLCGVWGTAANLSTLLSADRPLAVILALVGTIATAGVLYLGVRLSHLLRERPDHALGILHFNMAVVGLFLAVSLAVGAGGVGTAQLGLGLLILWYIRGNVKRLAAQECPAAGVAA